MSDIPDKEFVEALIGQALTKDEARVLEWLRLWEEETNLTVRLLIEKAHRFGYISGQVDERHKTQ